MKHTYPFIVLALMSASVASAQYCTPTFDFGCSLWRNQNIVIGDIDWSIGSTDCSISDYTNLSTEVTPGVAVPMTVVSGNWCGAAVWVDLDNSGTFEDSENLYYSYVGGDPSYTYNFSITIPPGTPVGSYRMRVIAPWGSDGFSDTNKNGYGPCGAFQYGNFDDFTLVVSGSTGMASSAGTALTLGPNPARGTVRVSIAPAMIGAWLEVSDALGHRVLNERASATAMTLDLSGRPSGLYFVALRSPAGSSVQRIILE